MLRINHNISILYVNKFINIKEYLSKVYSYAEMSYQWFYSEAVKVADELKALEFEEENVVQLAGIDYL